MYKKRQGLKEAWQKDGLYNNCVYGFQSIWSVWTRGCQNFGAPKTMIDWLPKFDRVKAYDFVWQRRLEKRCKHIVLQMQTSCKNGFNDMNGKGKWTLLYQFCLPPKSGFTNLWKQRKMEKWLALKWWTMRMGCDWHVSIFDILLLMFFNFILQSSYIYIYI